MSDRGSAGRTARAPWAILALAGLFWSGLALSGCKKRGQELADESHRKAAARRAARAPADAGDSDRLHGCTIENVQTVVKTQRLGVTRCYRKTLAKSPDAHGRLAIEIHIDQTGKAAFLGVQTNELNDTALAQCVFDVLRPLPFPIPDKEPCVVVYPFALSAGTN